MSNPPGAPEKAAPPALALAGKLRELGVTHLVTLPDNTSAPVLDALASVGGGDGDGETVSEGVRVIFGTREGEVIALASGLWLGGASPAVLIQNTGLLEAGDGLRGTAARMGAPLLMLVTCRGFAKARAAGVDPDLGELDRDILVRPDLDSVAHMTQGTLRAWGIPYLPLTDPRDLSSIQDAWDQAHAQERPVAVLIDTSFTEGS